MPRPQPPSRRSTTSAWPLRVVCALALMIGLVAPLAAQPPPDAAALTPTGSGVLKTAAQRIPLPFLITPREPLVALAPVASALNAFFQVGPLGMAHTLTIDDVRYRLGPENALVVIEAPGREREMLTLAIQPQRAAGGLLVPVSFLQRVFGDARNVDLRWFGDALTLEIARRELRTLGADVTLVHQFGVSTVEMRFSSTPRYRVARADDALVIELVGDRVVPPEAPVAVQDPLVTAIDVTPRALRVRLAPGADAATPRLLDNPPRLVTEVFTRRAGRGGGDPAENGAPMAAMSASVDDPPGIRTIVIDPGHGGVETGAIGPSGTAEKDLNLLLARALRRQLLRRVALDRVVLTRDDDIDLALEQRTAIANRNQADLFISLHLNSLPGRGGAMTSGAETYFLSYAPSDAAAAASAARENELSGAVSPASPPGSGEDGDLELILWELAQSYHMAESQRFASLIQEELNDTLGLRNRGVKQAPFVVLIGANMPSVLVELGFLSNPREEARLQDPAYRAQLVDALVRAVVRFKTQIEAAGGGETGQRAEQAGEAGGALSGGVP
ncbi:MAG: N-acetylmuramoyl-L-alanine amidase [Acidobacteriota bacterium]